MIEDVLIRKFVAEHNRCARANSNPAFSIVIVHTVGLIAPVPGFRCEQSYKSCDDFDEQLETVSAQIAPGLFRSPEISLPRSDSNIEELTSRLCGVVFLLRPSH